MRTELEARPIVALVADDDAVARRLLLRSLAAVWPGLRMVQAVNGIEAWDGFLEHEPALCFLDVRMPGLTGIEVAQRIGERALTVFVMDANDPARPSFEAGGAAHLSKPVAPAPLATLVSRLQAALSPAQQAALPSLQQLLDRLAGQLRRPSPLEFVEAGAGDQVQRLKVDDIVYFEADALFTRAVSQLGEAMVPIPLKRLAARLDPLRFWQIHRRLVVNRGHILSTRRIDAQTMVLSLREQSRTLPVARHFQALFPDV